MISLGQTNKKLIGVDALRKISRMGDWVCHLTFKSISGRRQILPKMSYCRTLNSIITGYCYASHCTANSETSRFRKAADQVSAMTSQNRRATDSGRVWTNGQPWKPRSSVAFVEHKLLVPNFGTGSGHPKIRPRMLPHYYRTYKRIWHYLYSGGVQ